MALDVGELVARLTLDDSRFVQGTQRAEQQSRQSTQRITNGFQDISRAAQRASQAAQAVEINRRLEQQARDAAQRIQELERNAQRADQSVDDITMNTQLLNDARRAAQQIEDIRAAARQAAGAVDNIELGNRLQQDLRAAQDELGNLYDQAAEGGGDAGSQSGGNFLSGFSDAIGGIASKTGPVAGSILGIAALGLTAGAMLAAAIKDGMQAELQRDLFQAQTGTTVAQAEKFARAAGEAYADVFGESVEENLSTLKLALQNNIIDPGATQRDAEKVVAQLDTISTALDTEVSQSVKAVSALMSTGLAASAEEAADMIANAVGGSANKDEDLLEVIWEYAAGWKNAGIEAQTALALIEQSTDSGAWNADVASDALREFGRRISEEGDAMVEGMDSIGLSGQEMFDDFVAGGERSNQAFDKLFDKIRSIEDPVLRNEAILAVLGDTAGDFFDVFASWDPSEALKNFGEFEGAAGRLAATMGGNAATSVEGAMRSISVVADGLKAALAEAFGPYIAEWADQISNNRAGVIQFFIDVGNGAFDGAEAVLNFVAGGMRGLAEFADAGTDMSVSFLRSLADMIDGLTFLDSIPGFSALIPDMGDASDKLDRLADAAERGGEGIASGLRTGADFIDNTLIPGVNDAQDRFNDFAGDLKLSAAFNDEIQKVNDKISEFGVSADGSAVKIENWTGKLDGAIPAQAKMHEQLSGMGAAFLEQNRTGLEAGATVEELTRQYSANRDALIVQAMQMGLTNKQALDLINSYGLVPDLVQTQIRQPGMPEAHSALDVLQGKIKETPDEKIILTEALTKDAIDDLKVLGVTVKELPDGTVEVVAETDEADLTMRQWLAQQRFADVKVRVHYQNLQAQNDAIVSSAAAAAQRQAETGQYQRVHYADGGVRQRANGMIDTAHIANGQGNGVVARTPLGPVRYAEGETGWEAYIPGALSKRPRSERILQEVAKRFGFGLIRTVRSEAGKIFKGDPSTLTAASDPTGWRALLGGDYSGRTASLLGIQEDHPLVDVILSARKAIAEGDYDGALANYGIHEDSPITDLLLRLNEGLFPKMADGGIVGPSGFNAQAAIDRAQSKAGRAYGYATLDDCSGHLSDVFNAGTGQSVRFNTASDFGSMGWAPGYDPNGFSIGTNGGVGMDGHMAGTLYGTNIESDGSNGVQYGGGADGALDFPQVWHWPGATMGDDPSTERLGVNGDGSSKSGRLAGATDSGVVMSTDGQRVFVTNWPDTLGGKTSDKPEEERKPILTAGLKVFENGGFRGDQAGIYADGADIIRFAEKGTGGEGYVPLAPSKRGRSVAITREIARRFGFELVPMADGGLTGFGGYGGRDAPSFDVPLTPDGWAGMSANKRRATMYNLAALGVGGAFALASGFDADGRFTGQFDTGANSHPALEKGFQMLVEKLEEIRAAAANPDPVDVQVDVDRGAGTANLSIMKAGM